MNFRATLAVLLAFPILVLGCADDGPSRPPEKGWYFLGLEQHQVTGLELAWPYLYACTAREGLFRARVSRTNPKWHCLGLDEEWCNDVEVLADGAILVGLTSGLQRSDDNGLTWALSDSGIRGDGDRRCRVTCFASCAGAIFAGTDQCGLYKSTDNGLSWALIWGGPGFGYEHLQIQPHPADCALMFNVGYSARGFNALQVSRDSGETWQGPQEAELRGFSFPSAVAVDPVDTDIAYVGTRGALFRTTDRGESWEVVLRPPEGLWFAALAHDKEVSGHMFAAGNPYQRAAPSTAPYLYETLDAGQTLEIVETPVANPITHLLSDSSHRILFVATTGGIFKYAY